MPSFDDDPFVDDPSGRKDVCAELTYTKTVGRDGQTPIQIVPGFLDDPGTTVILETGPMEIISDVRGRENKFTVEENGFAFKKHVSNFTEWSSKRKVEDVYCNQEMVPFITEALGGKAGGVDEVLIFQQQRRGSGSLGTEAQDGERTNPFAKQVHLDMPESTITPKLRSVTDIKFPWAMQGRVRQVNVWRPLFHPVYDCGLTVADVKTLTETDTFEIYRVKPNGEFFDTMGGVRFREGYKWYYMSEQTPDDVIIFMGYDSAYASGQKAGLGYTFHSAFDIPRADTSKPTRQSIEIRAFVLTYPATPLTIQPVPPGRLSASTPRPRQASDSYFALLPKTQPITYIDLDDPSSQPYPIEAYNERELYLVRHGGITQVVDLQQFNPTMCPRHPLHDSIMCRMLAAEDASPEPFTVTNQLEYEQLEGSGLDVLDVQFGQRPSAKDMEVRHLRDKVSALEKELRASRLLVAVLTKRLNEPELML